jgi:ATP/maltotriose-dependent transcriptional regulator MalT
MLTLVKSFQKNPKTPLSIRETEVLSLFAKGQSCTGIAETLCISRHTVRTHIRNIYEKLDVNKKAKAIEIAFAEKFI